ncbi:hypothetical protein MMPV_005196 [Pyropia vietnamensis]
MLDALPLDILLLLTTLLPPASLFALAGVSRPLHALFHAPASAAGGGEWFARRLRRCHPFSAGSSLLAGRGAGLALAKAAAVGDCHLCGHPGDVGVYASSAAFAGVNSGRCGGTSAPGDAHGGGGCRNRGRNERSAPGSAGAPGDGGEADAAADLTLFPICAACYAADPRGTTAVVDVRVTHEVHPGLDATAAAAAARFGAVRGTLWTEYVGGGGGARWVLPRPLLAAMLTRPRAGESLAPPKAVVVWQEADARPPLAVPGGSTGCSWRRREKRRRGEPGDATVAAAAADTRARTEDDTEAGSDGGSPRTVRPARRRRS